ncbi:Mitogen-activated protein kinase kinase kinase NPK1 [Cocos nucifera]|uniref:mitogen-activated protein kinase kinase kinase n=1 Tax=Cocos nucifera TaxID=13894 RepID=A0A8K0HUX2_COCNU|nr:Mitogen-activated protein kinase kinase kinase NPK1 [Cocos nucifera]
MQDIFGSVRRSLVFRPNPNGDEASNGGGGFGGIAEKIGSCLRKSRVGLGLGIGFLPKAPSQPPGSPIVAEDSAPPIQWRKGELIGSGAFGQVYMGMNLDSGELLAVKQVLIAKNNASKDKAQAHIRELEEEVKLLKKLSHPNIVRYLGTVREEETLNILLEFVPGGSISSLLVKFGSFPEAVMRMYTKQLLQGLEVQTYLWITKVALSSLILGHLSKSLSCSADIWSVGCTVIEMATSKPPWSQQYQEVAALFHVGTTKSHPPIPEHLSLEAKDFLLKCLQDPEDQHCVVFREPNLRPSASDLLLGNFRIHIHYIFLQLKGLNYVNCVCDSDSTMNPNKASTVRPIWDAITEDDKCRSNGTDNYPVVGSSFNPMSEPFDDWPCKFDISPEQVTMNSEDMDESPNGASGDGREGENDFTFPCEPTCEDDEVTETKIKAFLDEKALDLKKLQTPLYEFYNTLNAKSSQGVGSMCMENITNNSKLPSKSKSSTNKVISGSSSSCVDTMKNISPGNCSRRVSSSGVEKNPILREIPSSRPNELGDLLQDAQQEPTSLSASFSERRRKWKEELDQELEREREMMRQAGLVGKISPRGTGLHQKRDRLPLASPAK